MTYCCACKTIFDASPSTHPVAGSATRCLTPTLAQAGDAVAAVIDALALRDVTLVAHDLGGPAGLLAAARRADRIAALAAVNCFAWTPTGPRFGECSP